MVVSTNYKNYCVCNMKETMNSEIALKAQIKALLKFPDQNPNPVIKTTTDGKIIYANNSGDMIITKWGLKINDFIPSKLLAKKKKQFYSTIELEVDNKTFSFHIVPVPEFDFINIYGTDITADKDNQLILHKLAKYFSPQVYQSIFSGELDVKIKTSRKRLTIFFSDIKGFSELTERLEPEVLTELVTNYLTEMTKIAMKYGGTVDKYIGDAIMVFFGAPQSKGIIQDAISCALMAICMKDALKPLRLSWEKIGISQPLDIRIGIHTDTCTVGNFGSNDRLDYTTIGNGVNLASRLESSAEPNQILISEDTYLLIKDKIKCKKTHELSVKNITHPIQTYEVIGTIDKERKTKNKLEVETPGLSLFLDPSLITEQKSSRLILEQALTLLNKNE